MVETGKFSVAVLSLKEKTTVSLGLLRRLPYIRNMLITFVVDS